MKKVILTLMAIASVGQLAMAFCGFYVAKAGADLYNNKSEVILVRDGSNTTITMSNDFSGNVKDFAMVVPVPNVLDRSDIQIADRSIFQMLDAYSAPRLVEYYDYNPCGLPVPAIMDVSMEKESTTKMVAHTALKDNFKYKVTVEAQYSVEEYDIVLLSAKDASGLKRWLVDNGYSIPAKAEHVLEPYIKSGLKFFVVKVDLNKYNPKANGGFLRPLQIKVKSDKFMLPIRLGMANSVGEQDMIVYAFSKRGRVECTNYRTVKMPTDNLVPTFIKPKFGTFYTDVFKNEYRKVGKNAVFLEYAWNVTPTFNGMKCDPCVGNPPYTREITMAGVPWANQNGVTTFFTRLHVRYTLDKFPEDLFFQETPNTEMYQARYVITNPATGDLSCAEGRVYQDKLRLRRRKELIELASLARWNTDSYYDYIAHGTDKVRSNKAKETDHNSKNINVPFWFFGKGSTPHKGLFLLVFGMLIVYSVKRLKLTLVKG